MSGGQRIQEEGSHPDIHHLGACSGKNQRSGEPEQEPDAKGS